MSNSTGQSRNLVFDYVTLRLLIGIIAFALPIVVVVLAQPETLTSISHSYYTEAHDAFVGMLFVVAAFLLAYNGHTIYQSIASRLGSIAAVLVAVFPTTPDGAPATIAGDVHYTSAAVLFAVLVYFCWVFWRKSKRSDKLMVKRRSPFYAVLGVTIVLAMLAVAVDRWWLDSQSVTFWGEWVALFAFGTAWIIAGKSLPFLSAPCERPRTLRLMSKYMRENLG